MKSINAGYTSILIANPCGLIADKLPKGYKIIVGARGVRLLSGQRQHVGFARALYHHLLVIVLKEGTPALNNETEWRIVE